MCCRQDENKALTLESEENHSKPLAVGDPDKRNKALNESDE